MGIKLSGLISNMDTDSIVKELMSAQSFKKRKIENKKTTLTWKQDKWKDLNTKLLALYKKELSDLKKEGSYLSKKVTSSDSSKLTATASISAPKGTHTVTVSQLASSQYVTGAKLGSNVTASTKLSDLGCVVGTVITIDGADTSVEKVVDGVKKTIVTDNIAKLEVTGSTTIQDFLDSCKEAGLTANFDKNQKRLFISSKDSGEEQSFTISTAEANPVYKNAQTKFNNLTGYDSLSTEDKAKLDTAFAAVKGSGKSQADIAALYDNISSGADVTAEDPDLVQAIKDIQHFAYNKVKGEKTAETKAKHLKDIKDEILTDNLDNYMKAKAEAALAEENTDTTAPDYAQKLADKQKELTDALSEADKTAIANEIYADDAATYDAELAKRLNDSAIQIESDTSLAMVNGISDDLRDNMAVYATADAELALPPGTTPPLSGLGLAELKKVTDANGNVTVQASLPSDGSLSDFKLVGAADAKFTMDGADMTSSSNNVTVNNITLELLDETTDPIKINISEDTDKTYQMVKNFVKKYNEILKEMNDLYNADSARGYDPLTDEEKETMSDDQIEKWENKIKDALLRRDSTVDSITTTMRQSLMGSISYNGVSYSMASLGITTSSDYTEKGLLHILGDEEDETYSDETNKLKALLAEDPDAVMNVLTAFGNKLYDEFGKKMGRTSLSSVLTFYNDIEMKNQITDYSKEIKNWETKLKDMENRYYKQFTAMEVALSKLQSQSNSLASLMGTSTG